jgi:hypothetical protein
MSDPAGLRTTMSPVVSEWRAFIAPVNRATGTPVIFDPGQNASFDPAAPPPPWIDAGTIANLKRTPQTNIKQIRGGVNGGAAAQCRAGLDARVSLDFRDWGKVQMAVAGGAEHMNVLVSNGSGSAPSGGTAVPPRRYYLDRRRQVSWLTPRLSRHSMSGTLLPLTWITAERRGTWERVFRVHTFGLRRAWGRTTFDA